MLITRAVMVADLSDPKAMLRTGDGEWSSVIRGANFVVALAEVAPGTVLERADQPDESMLFLVTASARVTAGEETVDAEAESLVILPPGASRIEAHDHGLLVRVFSAAARDLADQASNAAVYASGAADCAPLVPWPSPPDGFRLRYYPLTNCLNTPVPDLRVFRCTNLMMNFLGKRDAPRDTSELSPHSHVDFEQASLAVKGRYIHHTRYPWTPDYAQWREDQHIEVGSPSVTVIPCGVIHTSRNIDPDAWLIDIFAPPRLDFSLTPGAVKNAADYPMPAVTAAA